MEKWKGKVAVVTGASSGIGAAAVKELVTAGMKVVGAARQLSKMQDMAAKLKGEGVFIPVKCDLMKDDDIYALFDFIKQNYGGVDVCINSAGMSFNNNLIDGTPDEWRTMMGINVIALCLCTKLAIASMKERGVDDGHIINMNSTSGHRVTPSVTGAIHFYDAAKHAVTAITEGLRQELREVKSHIRVSAISPGFVDSEFALRMLGDADQATRLMTSIVCIRPQDIAATVVHILSAPGHVEINDVIIRPTEQLI